MREKAKAIAELVVDQGLFVPAVISTLGFLLIASAITFLVHPDRLIALLNGTL